ncbi:Drug/Metabolite Transporter (DMT) Superfamily [Phytophthora infestans T30-4]|uniref:Drug/Metabolite Transporter (DMT) Superfamily n=1 Tax=Phytophthora infestans (strain T30-4) TaxID=403677 RepID=D0MTP1_PHYIT|nr:Drug/Metabolite Transporter (DMT) Superfamily [Phytophthora infestans T30-4]EEY61338.1 Drug/Metabolite Transporter (DMT) Superfamily [Phytophthora infestans T30-4]|eukprot:XP_002908255.1 Drug/Metabolite Transporter (DMT) Superfamily [Phytophthora infestans T30-4]
MVVQRRPMDVEAEVPTAVYALDLQRVSQLLCIPETELLSGFQADPTRSEIQGVIVDAGENVPFETAPSSRPPRSSALPPLPPGRPSAVRASAPLAITPTSRRPAVRQVLLTAAVRPSSLDENQRPKCLIQLGQQTIISHILTQLYAAGVERVVVSVAAAGAQIVAAVKQTPFYTKMKIEFLDLGRKNDDGHARSILAARTMFPGPEPFLIHTADHIFDKSVVSKLSAYPLGGAVACVLVETEIKELTGLPPTTVKVKINEDHQHVTHIGRDLTVYDGIDAGLFLSSPDIFDALDALASEKSYFSLAEALDSFTIKSTSSSSSRLTYIPTAGETWFSIETEEQLAYTQDTDGTAKLSPWTVFLASTPIGDPSLTKNVVIGVSAPDPDMSLRVAGNTDSVKLFQGFVVGVGNSDYPEDGDEGVDVGKERLSPSGLNDSESRPLLSYSARSKGLWSSRSARSPFSARSFMDSNGSAFENDELSPFVLSFPMDDETSKTIEEVNSKHHAYLIEMTPGDPSGVLPPGSGMSEYLLAVPGKHELDYEEDEASISASLVTPRATLTPLHKATILPSDITQIQLNTRGFEDNLEVTVVVKRKAPIIGYMLLMSSLFTISSVGVALDEMDDVVTPEIRIFWRNMATSMVTFPFALTILLRGKDEPHGSNWKELVPSVLVAGVAYAYFVGSFVVALSMTSVGHATLFNNAHSVLLVFWKIMQRKPVAALEALGAAIGVVGGGITTMDTTDGGPNIVSATAAGDLVALSGAAGGAIYFTLAKKVRPHMHLLVFLCGLTATSAMTLLCYMLASGQELSLSTDPYDGVFGWLTPSVNRLLVVLYLVFICDCIGTMGYIGVMKYFDPIVVSIVCLMEPIVATAQGIVMGVDVVPGPFTFIGAALVIGGTCLVLSSQSRKTEKVDATEAVLASDATPRAVYSTRSRKRTPRYGSTPH